MPLPEEAPDMMPVTDLRKDSTQSWFSKLIGVTYRSMDEGLLTGTWVIWAAASLRSPLWHICENYILGTP